MSSNEQLIVSFEFIESEDFNERVSSSLDIILKDLFSKGLLDDEKIGRGVSKKK